MAYNSQYVIGESGVRIPVSNLPIGIEFSFAHTVVKILEVLDRTELFKEITHRGHGIYYDLQQQVWNVEESPLPVLRDILDKSRLDLNNVNELLITSIIKFTTRTGELIPIVSASNKRIINILDEHQYLVLYKLNLLTGEIEASKKLFNIKREFSDVNNSKLIFQMADAGLKFVNIELLELDPVFDFSTNPIISTHQKSKNGKYYVGKLPVFNHDWQLNGEFEPRILLHPNILPLTMKYYKPQGESKWTPNLVPILELLKS